MTDVLVIDDSPINRKIVTELLRKKGYTVNNAESGDDAFDKVSKIPKLELPKFAIVDKDMPNGIKTGVECALDLKSRGIKCATYTATPSPRSCEIYEKADIPVIRKGNLSTILSFLEENS